MKELFIRILRRLLDRIFLIGLFVLGIFCALMVVLYRTQIIKQQQYSQMVDDTSASVRYEMTPEIPRGCIYDRSGIPLAVNIETNTLYFFPEAFSDHLYEALLDLLAITQKDGGYFSYNQIFPIGYAKEDGYYFKPGFDADSEIGHKNFLAEVYGTSRDELTDEQLKTTAGEAFAILAGDTFHIPQDLMKSMDPEQMMALCEACYAVFSGRFDPMTPIRLVSELPDSAKVRVVERPDLYEGFYVQTEYARSYPLGSLTAHILGYVGSISEEEQATYREMGAEYAQDQQVGKTGIEQAYEIQLHKGCNVYLSIDLELTRLCQEALEKQIKSLLIEKITGESSEKGETYPLAEVFESMIDNHLLTPYTDDSSNKEEGTYLSGFLSASAEAMDFWYESLQELILSNVPLKDYPETQKEMYNLLITTMRDQGHLSYQYQKDEDFYALYQAEERGGYDLFSHALAHQYIPLENYALTTESASAMSEEELIRRIVSLEMKQLKEGEAMKRLCMGRAIRDEWISADYFIELLFELEILDASDGSYEAWLNREMDSLSLIQSKIQKDELTPQMIALDPCSGSVVVTDPACGEVLAMVSYPTFDPMRFMNDNAYYNRIVTDQTSPLSFRAVYERRAIGSTYKMCTAITALELGLIDADTKIQDQYAFPYVNSVDLPHCWSEVSHGNINVAQALDHSCNYFFYQIGYLLSEPNEKHEFDDQVGLAKMANTAKNLGLAVPCGIEIGEARPQTSDIDAVRSSIGQGTNAFTTAQIARYTCTIANGGTVYPLFMVRSVRDLSGNFIYQAQEAPDHESGVSKSTLDTVRYGMRLVVTDEHQQEFEPLEKAGITSAGKTGTVQEIEDRPDHSLFTGFASYEAPEVVATIMIPFGGGSHNAIPVFEDVVKAYYQVFNN
ncbi:MAG: hypothetical protein J6P72_10080 [Firmicutes bacterium]|nr:hypothetical protein [Bacillota bacterium]